MRPRPMILLVGKSGTGKNYLCQCLNLESIPSYTTRSMRSSEVQGREHIFTDLDTFKKHWEAKKVIAFTCYCNNNYWATCDDFETTRHDVYIIDPEGIKFIKEYEYVNGKMKRNYSIVYLKASILRRIINMRKRGDSYINIFKRIINDTKAFKEFENEIKGNTSISIIQV